MQSQDNSKKFRISAKNLFLTYPKCNHSKEELRDYLLEHNKLSVSYMIIAQETHADGHKHLHAYVQNKDKVTIKSATSLDFKGCHGNYKSAMGNWEQNYKYLTKEDGTPIEWGEPNKAKNRSEETKLGIAQRNKLLAERNLVDLVNEGEIKIESYLQIKKSVTAYKMDSVKIGGWIEDRLCIWITDEPGRGKSRFIRNIGIDYYSKPQNKWWDGYKQEMIVAIEDFDKQGTCLSHYLKIWADGYSFYGEVKGGTVPCNYQVLIVTSNYFPSDLWQEKDDPQLIKAIDRRFRFYNVDRAEQDNLIGEIIDKINKRILS